jgi:DNA-binding MarR family transcriptional regulator
MTQLYKPLLAPLNLTYPQYLVMVVLWEEEGLGIKDIAERLGQDSGSVTPLLKRLEAVGYVIRNRNPQDVRNRIVTLTKAGKELRKDGFRVSEQIVSACAITSESAESLMANLSNLNANLSNEVSPVDEDTTEES